MCIYPVIQLPHLSVFAASPIVKSGQNIRFTAADKVDLNYCQDMICKSNMNIFLGNLASKPNKGNIITNKWCV